MAITVIMQDSRPDGAGGTYKKGSTYSLPDTLATYFIDIGLAKRTSTRSEQTGTQITGDSAGRFPSAPAQDAEETLKVRRNSDQGVEKLIPSGPYIERERNQSAIDFMRQDFAYRRRGKIGIGPNKAAVAIRFDDGQNAAKDTVIPLMIARQLPFSHALISRWQTAVTWGNRAAPADITGWVNQGCEIFSHD